MKLPQKMRAAVLVEQKQPLEIMNIELPETLEFGQVLVRMKYSGICGSQIGEIDGVKGIDNYIPHLLGHEGSGEVIALGRGVKKVQEGDHVVLHWRKGAGIESAPPRYSSNGQNINAGWITTFNEFAIVSENRITPIPKTFDPEIAALFGCAVTTGFGVIVNNAKLSVGESVVIFGAGGVGLNIVQAASLVSAYPIIAVDIFENRLLLAQEMGATHIINSKSDNAPEKIREFLGNADLDCFIDNTGIPEIIEFGYNVTGKEGRTVLVGVPKKGDDISIHSLPLHFGKKIFGSHGGEAEPDKDIPKYFRMYDNDRIKLRELITYKVALNDINDAIKKMRDGSLSGRCLLDFSL